MQFKEYNTEINFILPPSYRDFLGDKHNAILLNDIIEQLDLTKLYNTYKTKEDIAFMFLTGNQQPDFRTINSFRKDKLIVIENIFKQIVEIAMNMGIVKFGVFSIDRTEIYEKELKQEIEKINKDFFEKQKLYKESIIIKNELKKSLGELYDKKKYTREDKEKIEELI